jgi:nucleoside-diphosphate-sugar epimerase
MKEEVLLAGAGWLGMPLALRLKEIGCDVRVVGQTAEKKEEFRRHGIEYLCVDYNQLPKLRCKKMIICIPPAENYLSIIQNLLHAVQPSFTLFTSSTSVYAQTTGTVDETSVCEGNSMLIDAEKLILNHVCTSTVLRLGGLIGSHRNPARHFSGKTNISNGLAPVNLIHQLDILRFVVMILQQNILGVYNVVNPFHPTRKAYYEQECSALGLEPCHFLSEGEGKVVDGSKITRALQAEYLHPIVSQGRFG